MFHEVKLLFGCDKLASGLLAKLEHYGIRGGTLGLLESYLEGRTQYMGGMSQVGGR